MILDYVKGLRAVALHDPDCSLGADALDIPRGEIPKYIPLGIGHLLLEILTFELPSVGGVIPPFAKGADVHSFGDHGHGADHSHGFTCAVLKLAHRIASLGTLVDHRLHDSRYSILHIHFTSVIHKRFPLHIIADFIIHYSVLFVKQLFAVFVTNFPWWHILGIHRQKRGYHTWRRR